MGQRMTDGQYYFRMENFRYDGGGPDAYVYVFRRGDTVTALRSGPGITIPLNSQRSSFVLGRRYNGETLEVDIPLSMDVSNFGTFTIWCRAAQSFFTSLAIPQGTVGSIVPDIVVGASSSTDVVQPTSTSPSISSQTTSDVATTAQTGDTSTSMVPTTSPGVPGPTSTPVIYDNCEVLSPDLQVSWTLNTATDTVLVKLCGCIKSVEYMAFGISGSTSSSRMLNADVVVTWLSDSSQGAIDYYLSAYSQCRPGVPGGEMGACPDSVQGGKNDVTLLGARLDGNSRCVEYSRPATASEQYDKNMNSNAYIVWGIGPRDASTNFAYKHFKRLITSKSLNFGRSAANNCPAQTCAAGEVCPWAEEVIDARNRDTTFVARIGQSGGPRGYFGITGNSGWGIVWFINDLIIPVLRVTRGNKYTFQIYGGQDEEDKANYHPFYLTNSVQGGRLANNASMQAQETVFAGFDGTNPTAVGDLCIYEEGDIGASGAILESCSMDFGDYFGSLVQKEPCDGKNPGTLQWTPDDSTPDLLYYQCATHVFFGWKIQVEDAQGSGAPSAVPLSSLLALLTLMVAGLLLLG
jgi:hypothetical protein